MYDVVERGVVGGKVGEGKLVARGRSDAWPAPTHRSKSRRDGTGWEELLVPALKVNIEGIRPTSAHNTDCIS
jgi:hypothetical protein